VLKVIQRNKVSSVYIGRDAASTVEGSDIIRTTDAVLGSIRPSVEDYGTTFPESVLVDGTSLYFFDLYAKSYIVATSGGSFNVGAIGLRRYFTKISNLLMDEPDLTKIKVFSSKDVFGGIHMTLINTNTIPLVDSVGLVFDPDGKKWKSFSTVIGDYFAGRVEQTIKVASSSMPGEDKIFLSLAIETNLNKRLTRTYNLSDQNDVDLLNAMWSCATDGDIYVAPDEVNPSGMRTRIKPARFERLGTELVSDIPRDLNDTSVADEADRIANGRKIQGKTLFVTIRNKASVPVTLERLSITYVKSR